MTGIIITTTIIDMMKDAFIARIYVRLMKKQRTIFLPGPLWTYAAALASRDLYDRRLSQLYISLMDVARDLTADVVADQLAYRRGKIEIDGVDIFGYEAILQCPVGGLAHSRRVGV